MLHVLVSFVFPLFSVLRAVSRLRRRFSIETAGFHAVPVLPVLCWRHV